MVFVVKIKRISSEVEVPAYSYKGDAAFDLCAKGSTALKVGEYKLVPTGILIEIPKGYAGLIWDKSGIAGKNAIKTLGGVVDSGYRGEIMVGVINLGKKDFVFEKGQKVAQMLIQKVEQVKFKEVSELSNTSRGENGFGSSGK